MGERMVAWLAGYAFMAAFVLGWRVLMVTGGGRARVVRRHGAATLRPPRGRNLMFAGLALAPTLVLLGVWFKIGRGRFDEHELGMALAAALLALGAWLVLWLAAAEFRQHLTVDAATIERVFVITKLKVRWSEVERISWNPTSRWFFIVAAGAWLWVPVDFDGIADFAELALDALPPAVLQQSYEARHALESLAHLEAPLAPPAA